MKTLRLRGRFTFPQSSQKNTEVVLCAGSILCISAQKLTELPGKAWTILPKRKAGTSKTLCQICRIVQRRLQFYRMLGGSRYMWRPENKKLVPVKPLGQWWPLPANVSGCFGFMMCSISTVQTVCTHKVFPYLERQCERAYETLGE